MPMPQPHTAAYNYCIDGSHSPWTATSARHNLHKTHIHNRKDFFCVLPSLNRLFRGAQSKIAGSCFPRWAHE